MKIQMQFWLLITVIVALFEIKPAIGVRQCLPEQKSFLIQLRKNLTYDSSLSTKLKQWDEATDCCSWRGVECDNGGRVIGLDLSNDSISGRIDDFIILSSLMFLQTLNLSRNGIGGQIPQEFSRLTRLVTLDLSSNDHLLKLESPNLKMLVQNFSKLRELHLDGVDFAGQGNNDWCHVLSSSLPDLQVLSLKNCNISNPPDSSLVKLQSLSVIRLDENPFSAPISDFFGDFPNLTILSLGACNLFGESPQRIFQVSTLKKLDLSNNRELGGSLPEFPVNGSLEDLDLSYTKFSGNLPESIGRLRMLSSLNLFGCNFSGSIPSSISNLSHLVYLDFIGNGFFGSLPSFRYSKNLSTIVIANNKITGEIPPEWEGLGNLVRLDLSGNSLSGVLPSFLFALPLLNSLTLSNNQFSSQISEPKNASPSSLESLDLSSNHIQGPFPRFLFNIRGLVTLSLSSNELTGPIELIEFVKLENLMSLELSYNNLSVGTRGTDSDFSLLPNFNSLMLASCKLKEFPFLKNQSRLNMLDLSNNQITGEIPNWLWEVHNGYLPFVNLSNNGFTGLQEPYKFGFHQYLDLHSNLLRGKIPLPPRSGVFIDFSSNKFASSIPADIGNYLASAFQLKIANSGLVGDIPLSMCNASRLQELDLSSNKLSSSIPSCLIAMSRTIKVLNLRQNKLSGTIPSTFPQDCMLKTLDLSYNLLEGQVPKSLINCKVLKVLNLGHNRINGSS